MHIYYERSYNMRTKLALLTIATFFVALTIGCRQHTCCCSNGVALNAPSEIQAGGSSAPQSEIAPYVVQAPDMYMNGYNDGYSGKWVAPVQWTLAPKYRAGWDAGRKDFLAGRPNRYKK